MCKSAEFLEKPIGKDRFSTEGLKTLSGQKDFDGAALFWWNLQHFSGVQQRLNRGMYQQESR